MKLNGDDIGKIVRRVAGYTLSTEFVASQFGISRRRVEQLVKEYKDAGEIPVLKKPGRKPYAQYPANRGVEILRVKAKLRCGASGIGNYLRKVRGIKIDNNRIHAVLLEEDMAKEEPNKKGRKKPWIRYERQYSLSAGHMDWHQHHDRRWVCVVLDDASRKILSGGEYGQRSADAAVALLQEVLDPCVLVALVELPGREVLHLRVLDAVEVVFTVAPRVEDNHQTLTETVFHRIIGIFEVDLIVYVALTNGHAYRDIDWIRKLG